MAKQNLLLVDADLRSVRVLEVSLRKAGYSVASSGNAEDALSTMELSRPDLVLCDTRLPTMDGFALIQQMRARPELAGIPLMILSSDVSVETKVRGLELGVEDYLTKPIYIKELLARVNIVLQRKRRQGIEQLEKGHKRKFSGSLSDMGVVDLLQAVDHNKKSGVLYLSSESFDGAIYFCNGAPVDAAVGKLRGARAIYRTLLWTEGTFEIDFREIDREDHVQTSMQALLMEGLRRVDEWGRLLEQLPNLDTIFEVSDTQLIARLADIPDEINSVLRELDGERSLWQILDACDGDDLETLNAVSKLYFEGLLYNSGRESSTSVDTRGDDALPELSEIVLPHISSGPPVIAHTLAPAWPSVPSGSDEESQLIDDTLQLNIPATAKLPGGIRITPSQAPKRRKSRKRKKRGSQPPASEPKRTQPTAAKPKSDESTVVEVDETVAEITPSTIAPPPAEVENAAFVQAEQAAAPKTSTPPQLPRSVPASLQPSAAASTKPPELAQDEDTALQRPTHESPTLDFAPVRSAGTPPPLHASTRPPLSSDPAMPLSAAADDAESPSLRSTTPPPLSAAPEDSPLDSHLADVPPELSETTYASLPPGSDQARRPATPPPLPYVSKPPKWAPRGVTSPGFAAAPFDDDDVDAAVAAASSEAETAPPPSAASIPAQAARSLAAENVRDDAELEAGSHAASPRDPASPGASDSTEASVAETVSPDAAALPEEDFSSLSAPDAAARSEGGSSAPPRAASMAPRSFAAPAFRGQSLPPSAASTADASARGKTTPAPDAPSGPARDFEAAVLAAASFPPPDFEPVSGQADEAAQTTAPLSTAEQSAETKGSAAPASRAPTSPPRPEVSVPSTAAPEPPALDADSAGADTVTDPPLSAASAESSPFAAEPAQATESAAAESELAAPDDATRSLAVAEAHTSPPPSAAAASIPHAAPQESATNDAPQATPLDASIAPQALSVASDTDAETAASTPPREIAAPAVATASIPADLDEDSTLESTIAGSDAQTSEAPRDFSPPLLVSATPPVEPIEDSPSAAPAAETSAPLDAASTPPRDFTAPALATTSVVPVPRDSSIPSADAQTSPPLGAASLIPSDYASPGSTPPWAASADDESSSAAVPTRPLVSPPRLPAASTQEISVLTSDYEVAATSMSPRDFSPPALATLSDAPAADERQRTSPPPLPAKEDAASESVAPRGFRSLAPLAGLSDRPANDSLPDDHDVQDDRDQQDAAMDLHTSPGGYIAISTDDSAPPRSAATEPKRIRAPLYRTAVPPPFSPEQTSPPSEADSAAALAEPVAEREAPTTVAAATNSAPPQPVATASRSLWPERVRETSAKVISLMPRLSAAKATPETAGDAATEEPTTEVPSLPTRASSRGAWGATSGAPSAGAWSKAPGATSQAPGGDGSSTTVAPPKRRSSRWLQAGGVAATVALAAGLFALRARDSAPQASLNTALPEPVKTAAVAPPSAAAALDTKAAAAAAELEALHKQAAAALPEPTAPAAQAEPAHTETAAASSTDKAAPAEPAQKPATTEATPSAETQAQPAQGSAEQALAKGRSLEQKGKKQDALNVYAKAIAEGAAGSQLLGHTAFLYLNQGKNAQAEAHAQRAVDADETNSEAWIVLGAAQGQLGKKQAAEQSYRSCAIKGQGQYVVECRRMVR